VFIDTHLRPLPDSPLGAVIHDRPPDDREETMIRIISIVVLLLLNGSVPSAAWAQSRWHDTVANFATLPSGVRYPEGITANPANGDIYVATFDFGPASNRLLRYSRHGKLLGSLDFGGAPLLGLAFGPADGKVYIANLGASAIQRVDADLGGAVQNVAGIPGVGAPGDRAVGNPDGSSDTIKFGSNGFPGPNAMTFDAQGNLYVSDSFQGAVWRIAQAQTCAVPCTATLFVQDPLLATAGFPPFGANGLAFSADGSALFIANTGDDRVLRYDVAAATVSVFAESVNGADGIAFDDRGILWVAANQADEIVGLNEQGRVVAKIGAFERIGPDGAPVGLLFPASLVFVGREMYITNLALPLTPAIGDEPEEDVGRWTVSRIRLLPNR
jgi:DNA-binding beta-propeller fold protein YncE